jgi:hypothetical protein
MSNITINKSTQWGKFVYNMASFYRKSDWERNGAITLCSTFWYFLWGLTKFIGLVTLGSACLTGAITVIYSIMQGVSVQPEEGPLVVLVLLLFGTLTLGAIVLMSALFLVGMMAHIFIYFKDELEDKYGQGGWAPRKESQFVKTIKEAYRGWKDKYCPMIDVVEK